MLSTRITLRLSRPPRKFSSSSFIFFPDSCRNTTRSARSRYRRLYSIPTRSTDPRPLRNPAVSTRRNRVPPISTSVSRASRVVPATGVTIARSSPARALNREDFPEFGAPAITTSAPRESSRFLLAPARSFSREQRIMSRRRVTRSRILSSGSSSGKSISYSSSARRSVRCSRRADTSELNAPESPARASRRPSSERECIRSSTASAWARSILPLRKARRVNSPPGPGALRRRLSPRPLPVVSLHRHDTELRLYSLR